MALAAGISVGPGLTLIRVDHLYRSFRHLGFKPIPFTLFLEHHLGLTFLYPPGRRRPFLILQDFLFALRIALLPGKKHLLAPGAHYNSKPAVKNRCRRALSRDEYVEDLDEALTLMLFNSRTSGARLTGAARTAMREVAERMAAGPIAGAAIADSLNRFRPVANVSTGPYTFDATSDSHPGSTSNGKHEKDEEAPSPLEDGSDPDLA